MASDKKSPSETFSLDELKQAATEGPDEPEPKRAPPKARRTSSFIDDADSLLADIRDVVDNEVKSESDRVTAERQAAIAARNTETEIAAAARRKAVEEKLAAEEARRRAVAEERELRRKTLAGEIVPPSEAEEAEDPADDAPAPAPEAKVFPSVESQAIEAPVSKRRGVGFYGLVLGLPVLLGIGAYVVLDKGDETIRSVHLECKSPWKSTVGGEQSPTGETQVETGPNSQGKNKALDRWNGHCGKHGAGYKGRCRREGPQCQHENFIPG